MMFSRTPTGQGLSHAHIVHEDRVGLLSRLTFQWIFPLLSIGYLRPLTADDTRNLNPNRAVNVHQNAISRAFRGSLDSQRQFPLLRALQKTFRYEFFLAGFAMLLANVLQVTAPLILRCLLISLSDESSSKRTSLMYVSWLFITQMGMSFALVHYHYLGQVVGSEVKAVLTALIFEKTLRLSTTESSEWVDGKISNLITVDSQRIESAILYANMIWSEPVAVIMALVILFYNLTWSALGGLILLVTGAKGLDLSMGWLISGRVAVNAELDKRTTSLREALQNMKFVKLHAWESYFLSRISDSRANEVHHQHTLLNIRSMIMSLSMSLPSYAAMSSFIIFMTVHGNLTAAQAFSSLALFNCLRKPLNILPMVLSQLIDAWISVKRIETFLSLNDQEETIIWDLDAVDAVEITDGCFSWDSAARNEVSEDCSFPITEEEDNMESDNLLCVGTEPNTPSNSDTPFTLSEINLHIKPGELVAVAGPVGAGKSALLSAIADQITQIRGRLVLSSRPSFCSQIPWIESGTVRENIIFGKDFRQQWYEQVIEACALKPDLETWKQGDVTSIGEKGITLSGGQKQRISLARTIYADTDLILLDDPLSAVDGDVGQQIFKKAIRGLLRGKTCILVTHSERVLGQCDRVLWLEKGHIISSKSSYHSRPNSDLVLRTVHMPESYAPNSSDAATGFRHTSSPQETLKNAEDQNTESQRTGSVQRSVYRTYLSASGSILHWPILFCLLIISQVAGIFTGVWLSWWVDGIFRLSHLSYAGIYVLLGFIQSTLLWAYLSQAAVVGLRASGNLFQSVLRRVLYASMSFHTANPSGRLMNLFSHDVSQLDNGVSDTIRAFIMLVGTAFSTFLLISVHFPAFVTSFPAIALVLYYTSRYYCASRQELKRQETVSRSNIAAKVTECIAGRHTIRSFGVQEVFQRRLNVAIDKANNASYLMSASQQWLNLRLDTLGNILIVIVGILIVISSSPISPSVSGLIMTYALAVVQIIPAVVSQGAELESSLVTVERMIFYGTETPVETSESAVMPSSTWPATGSITMRNVCLRYRSGLPQALRNVSLKIHGGEKIGIIGRTGAGKSSIISVLFRLFPLEHGSVFIDDMDVAEVDLHCLRSRLSIIPQDPTLLRGTVRSNLDPAGEYEDHVLYEALRKASLYPQLALDREIHSDGSNFSLGERQLLALARSLVRNPAILICDEATSSIDQDTDRKVQQSLLEAFRKRTVICIAHRLRTVIRYDRICIIDQGSIVDFRSPLDLFDTNAGFREMCGLNQITRADIV
ncbi:P-loop containing nucleoside triphosphate hydrolase protein [Aspergillus steynii IBT 23096]|uniref:P-loop containing nucleoside triphosphate hydrolase protein n=1 Tax=Aspergillus steynii IBT 23096 TaxID=1392250 RepID=A0A2I2GD58_9EURO|nr:P-loop containing nucleoside triphosphate hydrolase protein [Aspergillus steynii IBT 23096]PLB50805.1 P-loop containing nucleoside triphosphate hydrolase protein [Aspergillus steynii IBT 23096]